MEKKIALLHSSRLEIVAGVQVRNANQNLAMKPQGLSANDFDSRFVLIGYPVDFQ